MCSTTPRKPKAATPTFSWRNRRRFMPFPKGLIIDQLDVDIIPGVGITGANADAANPKLMLDWSDDGGATWAGGRIASLGRVGRALRCGELLSARRNAKGGPDIPPFLVISCDARDP